MSDRSEEAAQDVTWVSLPTKKKKARHTTDALGSSDISKTEMVIWFCMLAITSSN